MPPINTCHLWLKINKLKIWIFSTLTISSFAILFFTLFCLYSCHPDKKYRPHNFTLTQVDELHWNDRDSAKALLNTINYKELSKDDKTFWNFLKYLELPYIKMSTDSISKYRDFFMKKHDDYHVGITYYMEAHLYDNKRSLYPEVAEKMKQAEYYLLKADSAPDIILGMIYLKIAYALYLEHMNEKSFKYEEKAIKYLSKDLTNSARKDYDYIYTRLACAYEGLMEMDIDSGNISGQRDLNYKNALYYARMLKDSVISYDTQITFASMQNPIDSSEYIRLAKLSCNTTSTTHWAHAVADYYIQHKQWDSAKIYLDKFALDTFRFDWCKQRYKALYARYLNENGNRDEAYNVINNLYSESVEKEKMFGYARSYAIAKQYDDIMEREENLRQQERQHKMRLGLAVSISIILLMALVITVLSLVYRNKKYEHRFELQRQQSERERLQAEHALELQQKQAEQDRLQAELDTALAALREKLRQRLELTKRFKLEQFKGQTADSMPEWVRQMIEMTTFADPDKWSAFRTEYNDATHGGLDNLKLEYPALTEADLQYIALSSLGLTVEEMCILLGTTNRTIWNRKQTVKGKME